MLTFPPAADVSTPNTGQAPSLGFSLATPFQTNWRGVCADYMGFAAFPPPGPNETPTQQAAEFDRAALSGIKMARTWYDFKWPLATYPTGVPDFNSASMGYFYTWLTAMQVRGIKVVLNMGWHFPGDVVGTLNSPTAPTPTEENAWKGLVSTSLDQLINVRGYTNIVACFFFTEPNNGDSTPIPAGYANLEAYYAHLVNIARAQIAADDAGRTPILPRVMLLGAEEFASTTATHPFLDYLKANNDSDYDAYTIHMYCSTPTFGPLGLSATNCLAWEPWNEGFDGFVSIVSPKELWADETGFLVGGDSDSTGYRATADAGLQLIRQIDGHMQAGCTASFPWMLQDQTWFNGAGILDYGVAGNPAVDNSVHPAFYAFALHANLTGGGTGTLLYRSMSGTATLHGTGVFVPFGAKNAVNAAGEWTFVVINEDIATDVALNFGVSLGGRTVYRYDYSGEYPPQATGPFLPAWTRKFDGVTTSVPGTRIPGRSVVIYSTMNISAPTFENVALTATATTSDAASNTPGYVNDGNWTNCAGTQNGWKKTTNATQSVTLTWGSAQNIGRVDLAFVATTAGVTWADYATSATPAPLADYTVEYWNGTSWVQVVSVTGNASPSRSHSFTPVSTTAIRLNVTSVAATAQVNQIGAYAG